MAENANLASDVAQLTEEVLLAEDRTIQDLRDQMRRMQADFEHYKQRRAQSMTELEETARANAISKLLPLLDNLERAAESARQTDNLPALLEGLDLVLRQMRDTLYVDDVPPTLPP